MKMILLKNTKAVSTKLDSDLDLVKLKTLFYDMTQATTCTDVFSLYIELLFDHNDTMEYSCKHILV